jgi:hypothetical protein
MPYKILKNENYENLGGLNLKVSPYTSGPHEFLALSNYDFSIPGALTKRIGSTQYLLSSTGFTPVQGLYEYVALEGQSMIMSFQSGNMYYLQNSVPFTLISGLQSTQTYFKTFVDRVFYANSNNFMKWNGLSTGFVNSGTTQVLFSNWLYSLPLPYSGILKIATPTVVEPGVFPFIDPAGGVTASFNVPSLTLTYSMGYVNERGFHGPPSSVLISSATSVTLSFFTGAGSYFYSSVTTKCTGFTTNGSVPAFWTGIINVPSSYGINYFGTSGITTYYDTSQAIGTPSTSFGGASGLNQACMAIYRDNGPGTLRYRIGYAPLNPGDYTSGFAFIDLNYPQSTFPEPTCIGATLQPRYLEIYNNQLFMGGFSLFPSIIQFSDIGEPESVQPGSNFELRTNDGDRVTGFKSFFNQMVMFKQNSFHVLTGSNINSFVVTQISDQYGCLSHNAIAIYETYLLFLDKKGIVRYNGANIEVISTKVESIFQSMNVSAAIDKAFMIHYKNKNQIWCAIPINGSTVNNIVVVYDYLAQSWTHFDGFFPNQLSLCLADQPALVPFFADYSGMIYNFGPSYFGDNGNGITTIAQARFIADAGQSVQKLYRQLFLNTKSAVGGTLTFGIKLYNDFGSTSAFSTTMVVSTFQNRIDFGLSVKSLSVEIDDFNNTDQQVIHGYALGSRFLRDV